ncbi:uncharacterized protein I206_100860 [Kwoniella pini CBS 10737]|uniref:DNA/RNA-binding domain-containing protein n=1 Tax=Kwoniella pini CBS 10737 TaxID=1296096 RepID=A0A1B9IBY3_9TREE|nr:uncharacterized protein I206_00466 [Kwoniella pini CBS 10737]OCF53165.1 hypothetical protein I206_00466 [Kwoniella pini CBS 10737]
MSTRKTLRKSAAELDRDARNEAGNLKNILNSQSPWSREAEQSRQRCREIHLLLIFSYSLSPYSQSLDNLWHQTSYLIISSYRNIISNIERNSFKTNQNQNQNFKGKLLNDNNNYNNNEFKKIITRFKQFLSTEETFYKSIISKIYNFNNLFEINYLNEYLNKVKIPLSTFENNDNENENGNELSNFNNGIIGEQEKKDKINLIYKGLICLGDLERYKEQYKEPIKLRKNNGNLEINEKFNNAREYYEVARCIQPDDGAAFNQLAVISTYLSDPFSTTYYYFRASAIKNAFKGIDGILYEYLGKATERWRAKRKEGKQVEESEQLNEVKKWKDDIIVLVGVLYLKAGFSFIPTLQPMLLDQFGNLVKSRQLATENIVQTIVIALGLHHHARNTSGLEQDPTLVKRSHEAETKALELLLAVSEVIMKIAIEEIDDIRHNLQSQSALTINDDEEKEEIDYNASDLSFLISAILRRILPSLRIMSKWIKMDLDYLSRQQQQNPTSSILKDFWTTYKEFIKSIGSVFPIASLPSLPEPLEEDIDMKGFVPLQRGKTSGNGSFNSSVGTESVNGVSHGDVHPNEEQLMRLADIQVDAKLITQSGVGSTLVGTQQLPLSTGLPGISREMESDIASVSTETEDDPVNLAMRATLASESSIDGDEYNDQDVDEVIVWNKSPPSIIDPRPQATVPSPTPMLPTSKKPTAYDLLQNLMLESTPTPPAQAALLPKMTPSPSAIGVPLSTPSPHMIGQIQNIVNPSTSGLLFGAGGNVPHQNNSIWTMTREESVKGQKRSSQQGNISAIWGAPSITNESNNHIDSNQNSSSQKQYTAFNEIPNNTISTSIPPLINTHQNHYTFTHSPQIQSQSQYLINQQIPQIQSNQTMNLNTWGPPLHSSNNNLSTFSYEQQQQQNQQNQDIPYYLQPAYYANSTKNYENWNNGNNGT